MVGDDADHAGMSRAPESRLAIIGGGPAGLMAAEAAASGGIGVDVYDAMPSLARKFLLAGKSGLNLTHAEAFDAFASRYGAQRERLEPLLRAFDADAVRAWAAGLGVDTFVGSSGRVFPVAMKASPLLRAWLRRLAGLGVRLHPRHRWQGWDADGALRFNTTDGALTIRPAAVILALGGGSWARLGSDGAWLPWLRERGIQVLPLRPANCGFDVNWTGHFARRFAGVPVKPVSARLTGKAPEQARRGEFVISRTGVEGSLIYALSASLRDRLETAGAAELLLDLTPDRDADKLLSALRKPRGKLSVSQHLRRTVGLPPVKIGLLREVLDESALRDPERLAHAVKALPLRLTATRPLDEAISSAGGVDFEELDANLMLRQLPGVFCAGEMLDWEAPTGGYLLTACLATGRAAGLGAAAWLRESAVHPFRNGAP
jgi:uncharacterized flavoprotein (TIGR03862 family)